MKKIIFVATLILGLTTKAATTEWLIIEGTMKNLDKNVITLSSADGDVKVFKSALMDQEKKYVSGKLTKAKVSKEELVLLNMMN